VPEGTPVTWSSSDDNVATVDGGNVSAVAPGNVTITAAIVVDGVEYSDTATVEVEAAPIEYTTVFDFLSDDFYNDEWNWLLKEYTDDSRQTYYVKLFEDQSAFKYSASGTPSTLYMDSRIAMVDVTGWNWSPEKSYALRVAIGYVSPNSDNWAFNVNLTRASDNFFTAAGSVIIPVGTSETFIPLECRENITLPRLLTVQIKTDTPPDSEDGEAHVQLELVEML
jgi:hypothetical protein